MSPSDMTKPYFPSPGDRTKPYMPSPGDMTKPAPGGMPGADSDEHGCKASAGYTWCASKGKCIRPFEEACAVAAGPAPTGAMRGAVGADSDEHGCKASAGYTWCASKGK